MSKVDEAQLSDIFAALANETRRSILVRLAEGEATVNEIAEPFGVSLPSISRHLKVLEDAGLIRRAKHAQFRPCALEPRALEAVSAWAAAQTEVWEDRLDRMEERLTQADRPPVEPKEDT